MAEHLGRYQLGEEIGRGAMAIVHRAYDPRLERHIAIKTLRPEFARAEHHRRFFLTEAHAAGRLSHPGIVTVHDAGDENGESFMAMELLTGESLQQTLDHRHWLPAREVVDIGLQLAEALDYAHTNGVVHRDIKPDNVVRMADGLGVRLTDFGIARVRQTKSADQDGSIVGTPGSMAPEQIRGDPIDGRADLYGLGVLLYTLLSGEGPFERGSVRETLSAILEEPPKPLQAQDAETPQALIGMIHTLLEKRPQDRYQTGTELAEDLRQVAREIEQREGASGWRLPLRVRWPVAMGGVVAAVMLIGAAAVYDHQRQTMTEVVFDYGETLAQTIATESAEDLLLEDRVAIQATVDDMQRNRHMAYISIADPSGEVVASTMPAEVGGASALWLEAEPMYEGTSGLRVYQQDRTETDTFLFQGPIHYGGRHLGEVALAIPSDPLDAALRTTLLAMAALFTGIVLTVLTATYIMAVRLSIPVRVLRNALKQVGEGRLTYRIRLGRRDEFGSLFEAYNRMCDALQSRSLTETESPTEDIKQPRAIQPTQETREMTQPITPPEPTTKRDNRSNP